MPDRKPIGGKLRWKKKTKLEKLKRGQHLSSTQLARVYRLRFFSGLSLYAIATEMGLHYATVKRRVAMFEERLYSKWPEFERRLLHACPECAQYCAEISQACASKRSEQWMALKQHLLATSPEHADWMALFFIGNLRFAIYVPTSQRTRQPNVLTNALLDFVAKRWPRRSKLTKKAFYMQYFRGDGTPTTPDTIDKLPSLSTVYKAITIVEQRRKDAKQLRKRRKASA